MMSGRTRTFLMFLSFLQRLFQSTQNLLSLLTGFGAMLFYYFIRKDAKLEDQNKQLKETLHDTDAHAHKVVETQKKQAEIAAKPSPLIGMIFMSGCADSAKR